MELAAIKAQVALIKPRLIGAGVERLGFFGSVVRGEEDPASDIDVLVGLRPGARTFDNLFAIGEALEEVFRRRVDLVTTNSLSPYLRPHIEAEIKYVDLAV